MGMNVLQQLFRSQQPGLFQTPNFGLQDPLAALQQLGANGDPNAIKNILGQLSPQDILSLVQAFGLIGGGPGLPASNQSLFPQMNQPRGCGPKRETPSFMPDMSKCFPPEMQSSFPKCCNPKPTCEKVPTTCPPGQDPTSPKSGKTFDVWFESKDGQKTVQRSPIVLDLNGNGRPDLTGNVVLENGRYVAKGGGKVDFDIDPSKRSWKTKSVQRRPGSGAPAVKGGTAKIYDKDGKLVSDKASLKDAFKIGGKNQPEGRAEIFDAQGNLVGEFKKDDVKNKMMYHFGNRQDAEKTEWMAGGEDGLLAWDVDGNGKIESSKELFGEFDVDGTKKFANGYEKLAAHFDANKDGRVDGAELADAQSKGVRVWRDMNGDAKTDAGELTTLDEQKVRALLTSFDNKDLSSSYESA